MEKETDPLLRKDNAEATASSYHWYDSNPVTRWLYKNREKIPGYGLLKLKKQASFYMLYVLFIMLLVYLLNQLDRYTISITAKYVGLDLGFGELDCMPNVTTEMLKEHHLTRKYFVNTLITECNKNDALTNNETLCEEYEIEFPPGSNISANVCAFRHDGSQGILYQVLAGPVFNNIYPLAGVFVGFAADRFNRKILLGLSLLFWSIATGVTGFATRYWMLVVFRMLLAIGAAGCSPFAVSIIADYFPQDLRGTAVSIYYWGIYFGYSLAYAIGNEINIYWSWRGVFFISGILGVLLTPFVLFTVKEPERRKDPSGDSNLEVEQPVKKSFSNQMRDILNKLILVAKTFVLPGMFMLCIAGGIRNAGGYVWAYNTEPWFQLKKISDETIASYMSVIPLVGGSIGAVVGGLISDFLVKNRGPYARIWVLIVSQLLAAPFAAGALFLPYPWCFITLVPSNVIGEMWIGVTTAIVIDLSPSRIRTTAIALYLFIITVIGGNFNVLVAPLQKGLSHHFHGDTQHVKYESTKWALFLTFPGLYAASSVLFIITFFLMRIDLKIKKKRESNMSLNRSYEESKPEAGEPAD